MKAERKEELLREIEANIDKWPERVTSPQEWRVLIREALRERREHLAVIESLAGDIDEMRAELCEARLSAEIAKDLKSVALGLIAWGDLLR